MPEVRATSRRELPKSHQEFNTMLHRRDYGRCHELLDEIQELSDAVIAGLIDSTVRTAREVVGGRWVP